MDQLLADTTRLAAESLQVPPGKTLLEAMVEAAMVRGLPDAFGGEVIAKRGRSRSPTGTPYLAQSTSGSLTRTEPQPSA